LNSVSVTWVITVGAILYSYGGRINELP